MKTNIKPTIDCVFKALLGSQENTSLLLNFLNSILGLKKGNLIKEVTILNPYNEREFKDDKLSIVDIKAVDENNYIHQVDVQISVNSWLAERMLFNWACIYHSQLTSGKDYTQLKPTTSIWLLEDSLFSPNKKEFDLLCDKYIHLNFKPYEPELNLCLSDHQNIHILQLPFFKTEKEIQSDKDRWLYFFKEGQNLDIDLLPETLNTKEIK